MTGAHGIGQVRVLFVINSLASGGAERSLVDLVPALTSHGIEVRIACLRSVTDGYEDEVRAFGCAVNFLETGGIRATVRPLRRLVKGWRPDVVQSAIFEADIATRFACWGLPTVVVTNVVNTSYERGTASDPNVKTWRLAAVRLADSWSARALSDHFLAISDAAAASAVRCLKVPRDRVSVIHRGRDPRRLGSPGEDRRVSSRAALGIGLDRAVLVNVARQEFQKGLDVLVDAVALVDHPSVLLVQAGREGNATGAFRDAVARAGPAADVVGLGFRPDVGDILAAGDIFVFPSHYEGLGGSVIEAMALGLPIVASDLPAIRELVTHGEHALLVPPGDASALAEAVRELLADPALRDRLAANALQRFASKFTVAAVATSAAALYRQLAAGDVATAKVGSGP